MLVRELLGLRGKEYPGWVSLPVCRWHCSSFLLPFPALLYPPIQSLCPGDSKELGECFCGPWLWRKGSFGWLGDTSLPCPTSVLLPLKIDQGVPALDLGILGSPEVHSG